MPKASGGGSTPRAIMGGQSNAPAPSVDEIVDAEIVDEFTSLDETEEFVKALFFGRESSGKTTAAAFMANLPGDGDIIVINAEAGFKKKALRELGVNTARLKVWNPPNGLITYDALDHLYYRLSARLADDPGSITGVILDSATEIALKVLEQASITMYDREQRNTRKSDDEKRFSAEVTELQDYGLMTNQVRKLFRKFRDLRCHFAATALETEGKSEGDFASNHAAPEMPPKLRVSVLGYVDIALRFTSETLDVSDDATVTLVTARTKPSRLVRAKDRLGWLPKDMQNPTFDRIVAYANGDLIVPEDDDRKQYALYRQQADEYKAAKAAAKIAGKTA